ncbi:MAG: undecaprenyl/decaprenyl-phosphate alpha-N-acetylglucosaminyl 1-phosphate transferase, partial [Acidobacteriota bacterium]
MIALFLLALGLGLVSTPFVAQLAVKINALDLPGGRKLHSQPVPRLGGIAIYLGFIVSLNIGLLLSDALLGLFENSMRMWLGLIFGGSVVLGLGIVDDIYQVRPRTKLFFQVLAAAIVYVSGLQITRIAIPFNGVLDFAWLSLPVTLLWIV